MDTAISHFLKKKKKKKKNAKVRHFVDSVCCGYNLFHIFKNIKVWHFVDNMLWISPFHILSNTCKSWAFCG